MKIPEGIMEKHELNFDELLENIRQIKGAIKQNSSITRQLIYSPLMQWLLLICGVVTLFVPFFYYVLMQRYIRYEAIPFEIRLLLIMVIAAGILLAGAGKAMVYLQARHLIPQASFLKTLIRMYSRQAVVLYPGFVAAMIFFAFFFIMGGNSHFVVPTTAIGIGFCFSTIGSFISLTELYLLGNYFWITGVISVPFISAAPLSSLLWTSGIFGVGMLAFYVYITFFHRMDKEQSDGQ
jgi:hypothetical protein